MPPKVTRRAAGGSSEEGDSPAVSEPKGPPREVFHVVETPHYYPLGLTAGDKVVCTGGWRKDQLKGHRLEFLAHVWNLHVGKQYIRCWWPRGNELVHLMLDEVRKV